MRLREGRRLVALRLDAANISGIKNSENIALDITSGLTKINDRLYQKGQKALFSTGYIGRAYDNAIKHNITRWGVGRLSRAGRGGGGWGG
ncbi:hypothetical protein, partial [Ornithobacterium rhinotracheale]